VNGHGSTNATTRRPIPVRRPIARIAGAILTLLLAVTAAAVPAHAATATIGATATISATATVSATAGTTWAQLMRRKLDLAAESARLTALLPALRATVTARTAGLTQAGKTQAAAAATLAGAATADQAARSRYATAKTAAAAARKAVAAAQKRRPRSVSRIIRAKRARTAADATVQSRAAAAGRTAAAMKAARSAYTTAAGQVTTATIAYQTAAKAVTDTQLRIKSLPALGASLAAQATAVRQQVVTQTRASFTTAQATKVYGITVNKIVAYPFQRMIDDAAKAGIPLSGGGFRTKQQQIALRTANGCPNIWTAPASSCRVPTAIPGRSLHELGLAIDMTSGRKSINDHKSAAFKWLAANAGRYGFVNLPSEPWHWSITGS
jgi:D-alanyl-D-alanine carboxypeptidase